MFIQIPFIRGIQRISNALQNRKRLIVNDEPRFEIELMPATSIHPQTRRPDAGFTVILDMRKQPRQGRSWFGRSGWKLEATRSNLG